jgi:small-conductance mechanosensitive channel
MPGSGVSLTSFFVELLMIFRFSWFCAASLHRHWRRVCLVLLGGLLAIALAGTPPAALAQNTGAAIGRAPVVVDGEPLFQLSDSKEFTAEERADLVNQRLTEAIQSPEPVDVSINQRDNLITIQLNNQLLLTVTDVDVEPETTVRSQARRWAEEIRQALEEARTERTPEYLQRAIALSLGALAIALALHRLLGWLWRHPLRSALITLFPAPEPDGTSDQHPVLDILLSLTLFVARISLWLAAIVHITDQFPFTRRWNYRVLDAVIDSFTRPLFSLGSTSYSITNLLILGLVLFGLVLAAKMVTDLLKSRVLRVTGVNRGAQEAIAIILRYSLIFIGTLVILQIWGLDISSLTILASALGVGIGFGFQDIAKNFGSGLILVFERPVQVGDFVEVGDFQGTVERIGARSTVIRTLDHVSIIVPNSRFLEEEVINWSHDNPISRLHLPVGVAYGSNIDNVKTALLEAATGQNGVLSTPPPQVFFKGFGDSSLDFELLVWTAEPSRQVFLISTLYFRIESLFRQYNVEIPFPQRDLHVRTGSLPVELSPQVEDTLKRMLDSR